jgi:D-arabinose 1-dehydrogenase-like Zn-dependent alcohol dehydrogenase
MPEIVIAGHEVADTLVDFGKGVRWLSIGTKVAVSPNQHS